MYAFGFEERGDDGILHIGQSASYPMFRQMREAVVGEAELIGNDYVAPGDLTYASDQEMEKAYVQHVSGSMFDSEVWGKFAIVGKQFGKETYTTCVLRTSDSAAAKALAEDLAKNYKKPAVAAQTETEYYEKLNTTNKQFLVARS